MSCKYCKCPKWRGGGWSIGTRGRKTEQGDRRPSSIPCLPLAKPIAVGVVTSVVRSSGLSSLPRDKASVPQTTHSSEVMRDVKILCKVHKYERLFRNPSIWFCKLRWKVSHLRNGMASWMEYDLWLEAKSTPKMVSCRWQRRPFKLLGCASCC